MNTPNSNPLDDKSDNGTPPGSAIPKPTLKVPKVVPTPSAAPNGKPSSPRPDEVLTPSRGPAANVSTGNAAIKVKVPPAPAARPKEKASAGETGREKPQYRPDPLQEAATSAAPGKDHDPRIAKPPQPDCEPAADPKTPVRQYFYPDDCRLEDVRPGIQQAFAELVDPCMQELVIAEKRPLPKAVAGSIPFERALIILLQSELMEEMHSDNPDPEEIERLMNLIDRAERRLQNMTNQLLRCESHQLQRRRQGPLGFQP